MSAGVNPELPLACTPEEAEAGFVLARVQNPDSRKKDAPPEVYALVRPVDACNRVLKRRGPDGRIYYVYRQRDPKAIHAPTGELLWRTIGTPIADLRTALDVAIRVASTMPGDSEE